MAFDLFSGIGGLVTSGLEFIGNKYLQDQSNAQALDLYHENQAYNTPAAQMGRLKAAGLNPNLVYGHGSVANTSGPAPTLPTQKISLRNPIADYSEISNRNATTENVLAQNAILKQQAVAAAEDNWVKARERKILEASDKTGYQVSKDDLPGVRLLLKFLGASTSQGAVPSLADKGSSLAGKAQGVIDSIANAERRILPWLKKR